MTYSSNRLVEYLEVIMDIDEINKLKEYELTIARLENFSIVDFVEMSLELKYETEILGRSEWYVKKKMLQDRMVTSSGLGIPFYEMILIEKTISYFKDRLDDYFRNFQFICGRIKLHNMIGKTLYLIVPFSI